MCMSHPYDLWFLSKTRLLGTRNQNAKNKVFIRICTNGCLGEKKREWTKEKNLNTRNYTLTSSICLKKEFESEFLKKLK